MIFLKKLLIDFRNNPDVWFFYGFLLTFTLSIRKVLFFYPIKGQFNEYTGIYLYLSDIFLILTIGSSITVILYNKLSLKSRNKSYILLYLKQKFLIIPLILIIFSFISVFWSENWQISLFRSLKLLEFHLLYLWIIFRIIPSQYKCSTWNILRGKRGTFYRASVEHSTGQAWNILRKSTIIIIFIGIIQSIIGIWQFSIQKSIGLFWLEESIISLEIDGVAKIMLNGEKYIRSYGLFPHSNILGGFLVLSIFITFFYFKMFHPSTNVPPKYKCSTQVQMFHVEHSTGQERNICMYYIILGFQILAFILTFSKSAWIGIIIVYAYFLIKNVLLQQECSTPVQMFHPSTNVPPQYKCSTWNILRGKSGTFCNKIMEYLKYFVLVISILFLIIFIIKPDGHSIIGKSINDRIFYLNVSRGTFLENPVFGLGSGQFVLSMENIKNIQNWQFQPVHNVFLLILNELGLIGLGLFIWFVFKITIIKHQEENNKFLLISKSIFFGFLFIMLADHYFWDIQQGQILFWLVSGIIVGDSVWINKKHLDKC